MSDTMSQILQDYKDILLLLNSQWPLETTNERVFARMLKLTEELGELSSEILTNMGLSRQVKIDAFKRQHLDDEWADTFGSLILLAMELEIDIVPIIQRKIAYTYERLQAEAEKE
jgi:NTP pyrophosphatase (non-canonical NTP hydrolase)